MTILNLIPIGLISSGLIIGASASDFNKELNNKITNERIYIYPDEIDSIKNSNSIIKVDKNFIAPFDKNPIGLISINKISKVPIVMHKYVYDIIQNKYILEKHIEYDEVKKTLGSQILFPNFNGQIVLNKDLEIYKKIKILMNNKIHTKSSNKNLIERYEKIIKKNIPNFKSDLIIDNFDNLNSFSNTNTFEFEIEENILRDDSDLYLMVSPKNNKLVTNIISDSTESIVKEKFKDDIDYLDMLNFISNGFITIGFTVGFINIISKN